MERALDREVLALALGEHESLPSANELQGLIAAVEVGLFVGNPSIPEDLLETAWYLHGVASAREADETYSVARQRRAFQVSAHVFDLALAESRRSRAERLKLGFAAQVGYRRGELDPNAMAVFARLAPHIDAERPLLGHIETVALEAGVALLGFNVRLLFRLLKAFRTQYDELRQSIDVANLRGTLFGASAGVVQGADDLFRYLTLGDPDRLARAKQSLDAAARAQSGVDDLTARWVAAHLLSIADESEGTSVWTVLPPDVPAAARRALTLTSPPVLTLWKPQAELLAGSHPNPLSPGARRVVLSVPTSAGKTLLAQLLMVSHISTGEGAICYVAPMRSLGREVRRAMGGRLAVLRRSLGRDLPDFFGLLDEELESPGIDVMTPERLLHLVHGNPLGVLARYSMFVFDEAHMLAEEGRGLMLETLLSFLHWRTLDTPHRLVLLSAAFGNQGQLMAWLDPAGEGVGFSSDWRGPRRLHALFNTDITSWTPTRTEAVRSPDRPLRQFHELKGRLRLRPAEGAETTLLELVEPVGEIAFRADADGIRQGGKESSASTPGYRMAARVATAVAHGGPVLVIMSSRVMARQMARAVSEIVPREPGARSLAAYVERRLGANHPLSEVIGHGVGFHHSGLPSDVLEAIEDGFRSGELHYLAATSTLTEGVNLPARTVVLAETRYEGQPENAQLRGARLVNAMGRAGRATKESEGWIVLCRQAESRASDFDLFAPNDDELNVESRLTSPEALVSLATFEDALRAGEDAVFTHAVREVADFVGFVWFLLAAEEEVGVAVAAADLDGALRSTLAFAQLPNTERQRWRALAEQVRGSYQQTAPASRQRWPKAGTSIGTARRLDALAEQVAEAARANAVSEDIGEAPVALEVLRGTCAISALLDLPENQRRWRFRSRQNGGTPIEVNPDALLHAWVAGIDITELADEYLSEVPAADFRIEQMVDAVTEFFEHFLGWTLGVLVERVNQVLEEQGEESRMCPDLPAFVRYGVSSAHSLALAAAGVRSRRLLRSIAEQALTDEVTDLDDWLASMSIAEWRVRFEAVASDLRDLLE